MTEWPDYRESTISSGEPGTMRLAVGSLLFASLLVASGCGQSREVTELCAAVEAKSVGEVRRLLQQGGVDLNADQRTIVTRRCRPFPEALTRVEPEALTSDKPWSGDRDADARSQSRSEQLLASAITQKAARVAGQKAPVDFRP